MSEDPYRVRLEGVDWQTLLPVTRLFKSFRMGIHPVKLSLGLVLVILLYLSGMALDAVWGPRVPAGELSQALGARGVMPHHAPSGPALADHGGEEAEAKAGVFHTLVRAETGGFERLIQSALSLDFGARRLLAGQGLGSGGVIGAIGVMVVAVPTWMLWYHPGFLVVYLAIAFLLTALLGGAICRLAALHACRDDKGPAAPALGFTARRYIWFVLAPIIPLLVAGAVTLALAVAGVVLFNWPVLDVIGGLVFGLLLLGGLVIAAILIALAVGGNLLWVGIAVEGTDAFDAISRAFNYVLGRPWRWLFYSAVMIVYGAITYLFVGLVVFLTLWVTKHAVGLWAFTNLSPGVGRFDAILPDPSLGHLIYPVHWHALSLSRSASIAAWLVRVWVMLLIAVLPAYAASYFFSAQTWIYLLLRQVADGTAIEDVYLEDAAPDAVAAAAASPEKVEPAGGDQG